LFVIADTFPITSFSILLTQPEFISVKSAETENSRVCLQL